MLAEIDHIIGLTSAAALLQGKPLERMTWTFTKPNMLTLYEPRMEEKYVHFESPFEMELIVFNIALLMKL